MAAASNAGAAGLEIPDVENGATVSTTQQRLTLDPSHSCPELDLWRIYGFALDVTAVHAVVLSAIEIPLKSVTTTGRPRARRSSPVAETGAVRVFATHTERLPALWDWRQV